MSQAFNRIDHTRPGLPDALNVNFGIAQANLDEIRQDVSDLEGNHTVTLTAGQQLEAPRILTMDSQGRAIHADSGQVSHADRIIGLGPAAVPAGGTVDVLVTGVHSDTALWSWDVTKPIWLGTDGDLTQTPPTSGHSTVVAMALSATKIFVSPRPSVILA